MTLTLLVQGEAETENRQCLDKINDTDPIGP